MSLNIGIIGYGKMGQIRHKAIEEIGAGKVLAISEPNVQGLSDGHPPSASIEEIMNSKKIDAIFICTPNNYNKDLTIRALQAGKHVFCEKPPAFTAVDVEEIIAAEKKSSQCKLMYGFNHRHHDSILKAKAMIDAGKFGKVLWMRGRYGKSVDKDYYNNWRSKKEIAGGGILLDQGIHMLDLFLHFAGNFNDVHAFVSNLYWKLDVEDNVFAIFRNADGVVASLHSTMTQWRHLFSLEIFLEKGYIVVNGLLTASKTYGREILSIAKNRTTAPAATWEDEEREEFTTNNSWRYEVQHFFDAITNNKPVTIGNSEDALKLMKLVDKIYENK